MSLPPGTRLGSYEVAALIGAGGMGEVYRAHDPRLGRDVAIKVLPAAWSADAERLQRFEQEARAAAALNHPNILAVYDIGRHEGAPYIVSELLEGEPLRERLAGGPLQVRKAIEYAVQIAHGLAAAHEKGIVHRDLKPDNLFITSDGRVRILDFGLAKFTQPDAELAGIGASALATTPPQTRAGVVLGTVGYMSPEQVRGVPADHRCDLFAFGLVLFEMLSGQRAFARETAVETMTAILKEDPPDLPAAERRIPPALERIIDRCLEKNPSARFQSAADLGFALEALSTHSDAGSVAAALSVDPIRTSRPRTLLLWAAALVSLSVAIGLAAVLFTQSPPAMPVVRFQVPPPPGGIYPGASNTPRMAISPDGQYLAFTANLRNGEPDQLWVRRLDAIEARPLASSEASVGEPVQQPFWSPDSRFLGFFSDSRLRKVDIATGNLQTITNVTGNQYGGTWNRDGVILFGTATTKGLLRVPADGGASSQATTIDEAAGEAAHLWPQFLPDGQHFLYMAFGGPDAQAVYASSLDSSERKLVLESSYMVHFVPPDRLFFVREGSLMVQRFDVDALQLLDAPMQVADSVQTAGNGRIGVTISNTGVLVYRAGSGTDADSEVVWFDRSGKQLGTVGTPAAYRGIALSPDDTRLAVHRESQAGAGDLWVTDLERNTTSRFTFDTKEHSMLPVWSPDGRRIIFSRQTGSSWSILAKDSSGAGAEEILYDAMGTAALPLSVTGDGRSLLLRTGTGAAGDLAVLALSGERSLTPYLQAPFSQGLGQLSPDGRWVAYSSNDSGRDEIYIQSYPVAGTKYAVSTSGGRTPRWRRDGRELFYLSPSAATGGGASAVMAVGVESAGAGLRLGSPERLFDSYATDLLGHGTIFTQFAVTSDGKRFLVSRPVSRGPGADNPAAEPLTVILNWPALVATR